MNSLLKRIYETGYVKDSEGNLINPFPSAVPFETGALLYDLVRRENLEKTLEVGMGYGLSTLFICQAHKDKGIGSHTAIDPNQDAHFKSIGLLNVKKAGLVSILRFFQTPSLEVLPRLWIESEHFDFAFIDGMHLFDYVLVDFFYVDKLLKVGGSIAFDDIWMPAIRKVVAFVLRNRSYRLVNPPPSKRITPLWRRAARIGRRLLQDPFERNYPVKFIPKNVCVLKKIADDNRQWSFHRSF